MVSQSVLQLIYGQPWFINGGDQQGGNRSLFGRIELSISGRVSMRIVGNDEYRLEMFNNAMVDKGRYG